MNRFLVVLFLSFLLPVTAHAQCTMPDGKPDAEAGVIVFNTDHKVMQYCNGDEWVGMRGGRSDNDGTLVLSSGVRSGAADMSETIHLERDGVLILTGFFRGGNFPVQALFLNGEECAIDRAPHTATTTLFGSPSCVAEVPAGTLAIRSLYSQTDGNTSYMVTHQMRWVVLAKKTGG